MSRPTGFAAKCRCGSYVGALDAARTDRADMGKILGEWLFKGCTVEPRFTGTWSVELQSCLCPSQETTADQCMAKVRQHFEERRQVQTFMRVGPEQGMSTMCECGQTFAKHIAQDHAGNACVCPTANR